MTAAANAYRPRFHFTPPRGWINDPNGLVFHEGRWHLFYQHYDPADVDGMQWGHAISTDLVHWSHLAPALRPDELGQIWSGSAVVDPHDTSGRFGNKPGVVCLFTYWRASDGRQCQGLAHAADGMTFTMYAGNPVIGALSDDTEFRDPKVFWHESTERWVMAVAGGKLRIYSSENLLDWRLESVTDELVTECPDLFELPIDGDAARRMWVLSGGGLWYMLGAFDGRRFTPHTDRIPMTYGPDCYATQTWSDAPDGRRIAISWLFSWAYKNRPAAGRIESTFPTNPWEGGCLSVAQELTLCSTAEGPRLVQQPVRELETLRTPLLARDGLRLGPGSRDPLAGIHGKSLDIELDVAAAKGTSWALSFPRLGKTGYELGVEDGRTLFVDRSSGGFGEVPGFAERFEAPLPPSDANATKLRVLIDRCSVEVFASGGLVTLPAFVLPEPDRGGIELFVRRGEVTVVCLAVSAMSTD